MEKTVEVIEEELSLLLHDLQEEGLSRHDLKNYFRPITTLLPSKDKKGTRRERRKTLLKVFLTLISIGLVLTGSMTSEGLSLRTSLRFHGLALIRIGLLKVNPIHVSRDNNPSITQLLVILKRVSLGSVATDLELDRVVLQSLPHPESIL